MIRLCLACDVSWEAPVNQCPECGLRGWWLGASNIALDKAQDPRLRLQALGAMIRVNRPDSDVPVAQTVRAPGTPSDGNAPGVAGSSPAGDAPTVGCPGYADCKRKECVGISGCELETRRPLTVSETLCPECGLPEGMKCELKFLAPYCPRKATPSATRPKEAQHGSPRSLTREAGSAQDLERGDVAVAAPQFDKQSRLIQIATENYDGHSMPIIDFLHDPEVELVLAATLSATLPPDCLAVPKRFLMDFINALDFHNGHGTPSFDRVQAHVLHAEAISRLGSDGYVEGGR